MKPTEATMLATPRHLGTMPAAIKERRVLEVEYVTSSGRLCVRDRGRWPARLVSTHPDVDGRRVPYADLVSQIGRRSALDQWCPLTVQPSSTWIRISQLSASKNRNRPESLVPMGTTWAEPLPPSPVDHVACSS